MKTFAKSLKSTLVLCLTASTVTPVTHNALASGPVPKPTAPVKCEKNTVSFESWREDFRREAAAQGISAETWRAALPQMTVSSEILRRDRSQGAFYIPFLDFAIPRAHSRIARARTQLTRNATLFRQVESRFGIPGEILIAFWGMENDFSLTVNSAKFPILTSMTTLAYDCRRPEVFRPNLLAALKLVENNELTIEELEGQWAGEMSGLQLTPSNYLNFGVDFDRDGRRDIVSSLPDLMASAANMFKSYGWAAGQPYLMEVKVPESMPWHEADLTLTKMHTIAAWAKVGVTKPDGSPLPAQTLKASLMLPMGRLGPAFLAFPNFKTLLQWNASLNNALTAAYLAYRTKDPATTPMRRGNGQPEVLSNAQLKELQTLLQKRGYDMGKIDGFLGKQTRFATKDMQIKLKMPADAYPTSELLQKLRAP